jgi:hypothetical protein
MMANAREQESGEAMSELKAAKGLVVAMIQTDANGKVEGTPQ